MLHSVVRDAVRRSTMTVLVEIVCSVSQEESARAALEAFCKATGGLLIGRRVIVETHKVLLMVGSRRRQAGATMRRPLIRHANRMSSSRFGM